MLLAIVTFEDNTSVYVYDKDLGEGKAQNKQNVFEYIGKLASVSGDIIKSIFYSPELS